MRANLRILGATLGCILCFAASAQDRPARPELLAVLPAIVGTWHVTFTRPPTKGHALVTFTSDRTSVRTTDRSPIMSPSHGAWLQTGDREYQAIWHAFKFDSGGKHVGNQRAVFRVTLSDDGNSLIGAGVGTTYTMDGVLVDAETAEGPFEGVRIGVAEHYTK